MLVSMIYAVVCWLVDVVGCENSVRAAGRIVRHHGAVLDWVSLLIGSLCAVFRCHRALGLENLLLRQQLTVAFRVRQRPSLRWLDRLFWVVARRLVTDWRRHLLLVRPETASRQRCRQPWRAASRRRTARSPLERRLGASGGGLRLSRPPVWSHRSACVLGVCGGYRTSCYLLGSANSATRAASLRLVAIREQCDRPRATARPVACRNANEPLTRHARIQGSGHQAGRDIPGPRQVKEERCAIAAAAAGVRGAGEPCCRAGRTPVRPGADAARQRSATNPGTRGRWFQPSVARRRLHRACGGVRTTRTLCPAKDASKVLGNSAPRCRSSSLRRMPA
jgi:hypothetical protein